MYHRHAQNVTVTLSRAEDDRDLDDETRPLPSPEDEMQISPAAHLSRLSCLGRSRSGGQSEGQSPGLKVKQS